MLLADDVVVQELEDLAGLGKVLEGELGRLGELLVDDVVAQVDALVADVDTGTGDQLLDLLLRLAAEAALHQVAAVTELRHGPPPSSRTKPTPRRRLRRQPTASRLVMTSSMSP